MKNFMLILSFCSICSSFALGSQNDDQNSQKSENEDKITSLKVEIYNESIYFHLNVINETENTFYSLIKYKKDSPDEFESVDIREGYANTINTPIFYSFKEIDTPDHDMKYKLIAIRSSESVDLAEWTYNASQNTIQLNYALEKVENSTQFSSEDITRKEIVSIDD